MSRVITRPLLAATIKSPEDLHRLTYPVWGSYKLDGIRCLLTEKGAVTRTFKPIPNLYVRTFLESCDCRGLDGELMVVDNSGRYEDFNTIQSDIMSSTGMPHFKYVVFDWFGTPDMMFCDRLTMLQTMMGWAPGYIVQLEHTPLHSPEDVIYFMSEAIDAGFEGVMLRDPTGIYKCGRSTFREGILLKYKLFLDAEGVVIGTEELLTNENEAQQDAFGLTKRSSHKEHKKAAGILGALLVKTEWGELRIGTGFDLTQRGILWKIRDDIIGRTVTFKYQPFGMQDGGLPRFPVFLRFRDPE